MKLKTISLLLQAVTLVHVVASESFVEKFFYKFAEDSQSSNKIVNNRGIHHVICNENELLLHLSSLEIIGPDRIVTLIAAENVNDFCIKLNTTLEAVASELKNCVVLSQENLYLHLLNGTQVINRMLCHNEKFRKSYQKYEECIQQLYDEYRDCEGYADWFEDTDIQRLCQTYNSIISCNFYKTAEVCGVKAAHFIHYFGREVFKAVTSVNCQSDAIKQDVPLPLSSKSKTLTSKCIFIITFSIVLQYLLFVMKKYVE